MNQAGQHGVPLRTIYRQLYRDKFWADVEAGVTKPFVLPQYLVGILIIPALYLAIPHKDRPWLYRARWLVLALTTALHLHMIRNVSSMNFASAYGVGLIAAWGTIWNFALLAWTRPQWDAKRVHRRAKLPKGTSKTGSSNGNATAAPPAPTVRENGNGHTPESRSKEQQPTSAETSARQTNGHAKPGDDGETSTKVPRQRRTRAQETAASHQELVARADEQEYEYYWQEYPADASFWARLDWAFALVTNVRMTGWNWAIPCLPPYEPPPFAGDTQLALTHPGLPHRSKQGFSRALTRRQLLRERLLYNVIPGYLVLDFCVVATSADPYFLLGPSHAELDPSIPLPPHLSALGPVALSALRTALAFFAMLAALQLVWNAAALSLSLLASAPFPFPSPSSFPFPSLGLRAHPWHLPTMFGSFAQVLDRGLAGFWGAWWHQTFRFGFSAPARRLRRRLGYPPRGALDQLAGALLAFLQSGLVHAAASATTVPPSRWDTPLLFFLLAGLGTLLQARLSSLLRPLAAAAGMSPPPRAVRRAANLAFAAAWLWATSWMLVDDFGRCGLFLYDPLPMSALRPLSARIGGDPADTAVLRFDAGALPRWWSGARWWESGVVF